MPYPDTLSEAITIDLTQQLEALHAQPHGYAPALRIPEAMLAAAPEGELRKPYMLGAIAAAARRVNPIALPEKFDCDIPLPPDPDKKLWWKYVEVDELPYLVNPSIEKVREEAPDLVLAADRGARPAGLAVYRGWHHRYPDSRFPTIDGKIHFGRVSKKIGYEATAQVVRYVLNASGTMAEMAQRQAEGDTRPIKVLFMDDWVHHGTTVEHVRQVVQEETDKFGIPLDFALCTMRGTLLEKYRHVTGDTRRDQWAVWTDNDAKVGVTYDWSGSDNIRPRAVRDPEARQLRKDIDKEIRAQIKVSPHPKTSSPSHARQATTAGRPKSFLARLLGR